MRGFHFARVAFAVAGTACGGVVSPSGASDDDAGPGSGGERTEMPGGSGGAGTDASGGARTDGTGGAGTDGGVPTGTGGRSSGTGGSVSGGGAPSFDASPAAGGSATAVPVLGPYPLTESIPDGPWYATQFTIGMAADSRGRVFLADYAGVYVVEGGAVSTYLTAEEIQPAVGWSGIGSIQDLDVGPDDTVYVLFDHYLLTSTAAHEATLVRDTLGFGLHEHIGVFDGDAIALTGRDGVETFSSDAGRTVYMASEVESVGSGCATEDFAVTGTGVFLYEPGCNLSPLLRGNMDGSGVSVLFEASDSGPLLADRGFRCVGRDPSTGGFLLVTSDGDDYSHLYSIAADSDGATGISRIDTSPTFEALQTVAQAQLSLAFRFCSVTAASDGTIYIQTYEQLWKVERR